MMSNIENEKYHYENKIMDILLTGIEYEDKHRRRNGTDGIEYE